MQAVRRDQSRSPVHPWQLFHHLDPVVCEDCVYSIIIAWMQQQLTWES